MPASMDKMQNSLGSPVYKSNPFDSESDSEVTSRPPRASSVPVQSKAKSKISLFNYDEDRERRACSASSAYSSAVANNRYSKGFHQSAQLENQSVQELDNYAVLKAQETTKKVNDCLKVAEVIREDATHTLLTLHRQGEQIMRTHQTAANIEHGLSVVVLCT